MQAKQGKEQIEKATVYLSSELRRKLKIQAATLGDPMSVLVEKALTFYLSHPDIVERQGVGHTHELYNCPECNQALVFKNGELVAITSHTASPCHPSNQSTSDEELLVH